MNPQQKNQIGNPKDTSAIGIYFDNIQDYIKNTIDIKENELENVIKKLENDNIQSVINKDFHDNVTIEDCAEKIIKMIENAENISDVIEPNQIEGERALNTMEKRILNYNDFINENFK
jgi:hypothetical protein